MTLKIYFPKSICENSSDCFRIPNFNPDRAQPFKDPSIFFITEVTFLDRIKDVSERTLRRLKRVAHVNFYSFSFFNYIFIILISLIFHMLKNL